MNRRNFIILTIAGVSAAALPLALREDDYDRFLRELNQRVRETVIQNKVQLERIVIDPIEQRGGTWVRLVKLYVHGRKQPLQWYQVYG